VTFLINPSPRFQHQTKNISPPLRYPRPRFRHPKSGQSSQHSFLHKCVNSAQFLSPKYPNHLSPLSLSDASSTSPSLLPHFSAAALPLCRPEHVSNSPPWRQHSGIRTRSKSHRYHAPAKSPYGQFPLNLRLDRSRHRDASALCSPSPATATDSSSTGLWHWDTSAPRSPIPASASSSAGSWHRDASAPCSLIPATKTASSSAGF
uniref:Uncharacterized protein n=1 Tax=Myripristis murdjan TaxID=586833 RepID=A0A667ZAI3_9TELE